MRRAVREIGFSGNIERQFGVRFWRVAAGSMTIGRSTTGLVAAVRRGNKRPLGVAHRYRLIAGRLPHIWHILEKEANYLKLVENEVLPEYRHYDDYDWAAEAENGAERVYQTWNDVESLMDSWEMEQEARHGVTDDDDEDEYTALRDHDERTASRVRID